MFSDTITYKDFNGNQCSETLYFNISETEGFKFLNSVEGGYDAYLQTILDKFDKLNDDDDHQKIKMISDLISVYEDIILAAYGEKSEDGKRFMKSDEITNGFRCSAAYDALIQKFFEDPEYAVKFTVAVLPNNTGMSDEEVIASVKQDSNTIDLTNRFKEKIADKKLETSSTE